MGRIRLQICVLPWEQPSSSASTSAQARQEVKWCEPCTEDTPMQVACDRIYKSWKRMFEDTMGPLKIRHLKTAYGDFLDLQERVVGDFFDDRGADGNIRNSILEVHRYPPTPDQLEALQRFSSLAPTSSARPRKRPLELPSEPYPPQFPHNIPHALPSIEQWDTEAGTSSGTGAKRQRTHESRLNRRFDAHQSLTLREQQAGKPFHSSQTSGTQESIHQVLDSQQSHRKKHLNPYDTPTSLAIVGLQESIPSSEIGLSAVPDSPLGREAMSAGGTLTGAVQLDRESTKSESPELRASVHEVPPAHPIDKGSQQPVTSATLPEPSAIPYVVDSASQPASASQNVHDDLGSHNLRARRTSEHAGEVNQLPSPRVLATGLALAQNDQIHSNPLPESDPIFDPIESDTESFLEKQQMQSAKRLRSGRTPNTGVNSLRAPNKAGVDRRDGQFIRPALPQLRTNGAHKSSCEISTSGQGRVISQRSQDSEHANIGVQNDLARHDEHSTDALDDAQSEACNSGKVNIARDISIGNTVCHDTTNATQISSQATTAWSQDPDRVVDGNAPSIAQRDKIMSTQRQEVDHGSHSGNKVDVAGSSPDDDFMTQAELQAIEAVEQQVKTGTRQKQREEKGPAQEILEKGNATGNEVAKRRDAKGEKAQVEGSTQAKKASAKAIELAETKRREKPGVHEARSFEEKKVSEKLAREKQTRERSLAEEANKLKLLADGAKQIEKEKKGKEKARHEELAAKKQANEAKAPAKVNEPAQKVQSRDCEKNTREGRRARESVQTCAEIEYNNAQDQGPQRWTDRETAAAVKEKVEKKIAAREAQKRRHSEEARSRASSNPLAFSESLGIKRSMTPRIPGSVVTTPLPQRNSLQSSPFSNRTSGNMDPPPRSSLRQTSGGKPRSASSVSFLLPESAKPEESVSSTPNLKSLLEINSKFATKPSSATTSATDPSKSTSNPPSKTPMKSLTSRKASDGNPTKTPARNRKVQTKLNVTREVKKLKGRAIAPPIRSIKAPKQALVISSGEDSSTSEEPVWQTGNAEAGPSSRKLSVLAASQRTKAAGMKASGAHIDPTINNIKTEDRTVSLAAHPRRTSALGSTSSTSLPNSTSRSPAQVVSETISLSSGSASSMTSESGLESVSTEEPQVPLSKTPPSTRSGTHALASMKGSTKAVSVGSKQRNDHLKSKTLSQSSSQVPSSRSHSIISVKGHGEHVGQTADKQLQLESQQSLTNSCVDQTSSTADGAVAGKVINQGLDHAGRLPNGIRPAYYKYPGLSELQKLPRENMPKTKTRLDTFSLQPVGASPAEISRSGSSSSESDESSRSDDEGFDGSSCQIKPRKSIPGMRGLMKLTKLVQSPFGSSQR